MHSSALSPPLSPYPFDSHLDEADSTLFQWPSFPSSPSFFSSSPPHSYEGTVDVPPSPHSPHEGAILCGPLPFLDPSLTSIPSSPLLFSIPFSPSSWPSLASSHESPSAPTVATPSSTISTSTSVSSSSPVSVASHLAVPRRPRFWSRKVACQVCHFVKEKCQGGRPCDRCTRLGHTANCIDRPSKRRQAPQSSSHRRTDPPPPSNKRRLQTIPSPADVASEAAGDGLRLNSRDKRLVPAADEERLQSCWSERSAIVRPPSLPFSASYLPVDGLQLSRSLLTSHFQFVGRFQQLSSRRAVKRTMDLREKLLGWQWMQQMLTPEDARALVHSAQLRPTWFSDIFGPSRHPLLDAAVTTFIAHTTSTSPDGGSDHTADGSGSGQCDGRGCFGFCPLFQALSAATWAEYCWRRSPQHSLPDHADRPNHPLLIIRYLHDDEAVQSQRMALDEAAAKVAMDLIKRHTGRETPQTPLTLSPAPLPCEEQSAEGEEEGAQRPLCSVPLLFDVASPQSALSPIPRVEMSLSVQVNGAFERLLGYRQAELREAFIGYGEKALYHLFRADSWLQLMELDKEIKLGWRREFSGFTVCLTKRRTEVDCLLHCLSRFDGTGRPRVSYLTFMPLPQPRNN